MASPCGNRHRAGLTAHPQGPLGLELRRSRSRVLGRRGPLPYLQKPATRGGQMRRIAILWLLAGVAAVVVAACSRPAANHEQASPPVSRTQADPATVCSGLPAPGAIPSGFRAATVVQCSPEIHQLSGRGLRVVTVVRQADTPPPALIEALRASSAPPSSGPCTAEAVALAPVILVDAQGHSVRPRIPTDGCGRPQAAVTNAIAQLAFRTVAVLPQRPATN